MRYQSFANDEKHAIFLNTLIGFDLLHKNMSSQEYVDSIIMQTLEERPMFSSAS